MSARRVEYTSCPDGMDGIGGFQVRASTPHVAQELLEEALAAAVFEPSYDLPPSPDEVALADFPISFGLVITHQGAAIYRSNYVGRDYTGRWGNYFAQVLVVESLEALDGLMPIDLWESPLWRSRSEAVGTLPPVEVARDAAGPLNESVTAEFLSQPGRVAHLAVLLASVRQTFTGGDRLVIVVEDSATAAQWLDAISRSLPRATVLQMTFTTWTSRPQSQRAHVTFVTPGVSRPSYGAFRTLDATSSAGPPRAETDDFARIVAASWREDGPSVLLGVVDDRRLPDSDLDALARLAVFAGLLPGEPPTEEGAMLRQLMEVERLAPEWARAAWWEAGELVNRGQVRMGDSSAWGTVLSRTPLSHVPPTVLAAYLNLAVRSLIEGSHEDLWMPPLDESWTRKVARDSIVPALVGGDRPDVARWLIHRADPVLRDAALAVLEAQLAPVTQLQDVVSRMPVPAAQFVAAHPSSSERLALFAGFVMVRGGVGDPAALLTSPVLERSLVRPEDWAALPAQLWPSAPPSAPECLRLLRELPSRTVQHMQLIDLALDRLAADTSTGHVDDDVLRLASAVVHVAADAREADLSLALVVRASAFFETATADPRLRVRPHLEAALSTTRAVPDALRERTWTAMTEWSLHHPEACGEVFETAQRAGSWSEFCEHFCAHAPKEISRLPAAPLAGLSVAWFAVAHGAGPEWGALSERLLHEVLPRALHRSSRRTLDAVGSSLPGEADRLLGRGVQPDAGWAQWWNQWRTRHEAQGLMARLRRRGGDG